MFWARNKGQEVEVGDMKCCYEGVKKRGGVGCGVRLSGGQIWIFVFVLLV